jgi:hydrogenase nickel incorporation protein HypA/HybF
MFDDLMRRIVAVAARERARRIVAVKVRLGRLSHLTPEHFREHFEDASRGTPAEGARVDIEDLPDLDDPCATSVRLESVEIEN